MVAGCGQFAGDGAELVPPQGSIHLDLSRPGSGYLVLAHRRRQHATREIDQDSLAAGRADVDTDHRGGHPTRTSPHRWTCTPSSAKRAALATRARSALVASGAYTTWA